MDRLTMAAADQSSGHPAGKHTPTALINPDASLVCYLREKKSHSLLAAPAPTHWWIDKLFKEPFIQRADHAGLMDG